MISIDGSVILQIFNFLILLWVLNIVLYRPIRNVLRLRKSKVADLEKGILASQEAMKEKDEAYKRGLQAARVEGLKEKEVYLEEAAAEEHKMIDAINQKAQADMVVVRDKIAAETESVRQTLLNQVDEFAEAITAKILGGAGA